jgi:exosortase D (VPLPA-CTERM-specific)
VAANLLMLVFLIGSIWLLYGWGVIKVLRFPLAFLFLMLPLPGFIYRNLTFPLQLISSAWSVNLLHLLGIKAYREGNVIDMGFTQFQVVEACNGLRFILPLLIIGVLMAFFSRKALWKRIFLIAAAVPIAIMANVIRIAGTGIIARQWGVEAAEGFFHSFSGWVVFMVCFVVFALLSFVLDRIPERKKEPPDGNRTGNAHRKAGLRRLQWLPLVIAAAVILAAPPVVDQLGRVPPIPLERPLAEFPDSYDQWRGRTLTMEERIWEQVGGQEYVMIDYLNGGQPPVNFYAAYYEYQRKAGDFIHSPKLCLPGAGWHIQESRIRRLNAGDPAFRRNGGLVFNEIVIQKPGVNQLVYYWYQGRGRNFTNEYLAKFYMVWDGIFRRRTDGALVRLIRPIDANETLADARQILDSFAVFVSRELTEYLPN